MEPMFDYQAVARELHVPPEQLAELEAVVRSQYGSDEMLFELRMLRTLDVVAEGRLTLPEAIRQLKTESSRTARAG
jgi:hypothetical protein